MSEEKKQKQSVSAVNVLTIIFLVMAILLVGKYLFLSGGKPIIRDSGTNNTLSVEPSGKAGGWESIPNPKMQTLPDYRHDPERGHHVVRVGKLTKEGWIPLFTQPTGNETVLCPQDRPIPDVWEHMSFGPGVKDQLPPGRLDIFGTTKHKDAKGNDGVFLVLAWRPN